MPEWMQTVNQFNPISYVIEAIRALMITGYDWNAIGAALLSMAIVGVILQAGTIWAFNRVAR
jgi:ABC-2 type transport system permease protein